MPASALMPRSSRRSLLMTLACSGSLATGVSPKPPMPTGASARLLMVTVGKVCARAALLQKTAAAVAMRERWFSFFAILCS